MNFTAVLWNLFFLILATSTAYLHDPTVRTKYIHSKLVHTRISHLPTLKSSQYGIGDDKRNKYPPEPTIRECLAFVIPALGIYLSGKKLT